MNLHEGAKPTTGNIPREFFCSEDSQSIVEAIARAERATSGEIRVHLERSCRDGDPIARGKAVFDRLGMWATADRNGVLVYLALGDRTFAVLGDTGIHEKVDDDFWAQIVHTMETRFAAGEFATGLIEAIEEIGGRLSEHFPYAGDAHDVNELPDDISVEEDGSE